MSWSTSIHVWTELTRSRGIPTVKASTGDNSKLPRDSGRDEALAKAKAAVEAETKKDEESHKPVGKTEEHNGAENTHTNAEAVPGTKRAREDDGGEGETRETKKVDVKAEAVPVNGAS